MSQRRGSLGGSQSQTGSFVGDSNRQQQVISFHFTKRGPMIVTSYPCTWLIGCSVSKGLAWETSLSIEYFFCFKKEYP